MEIDKKDSEEFILLVTNIYGKGPFLYVDGIRENEHIKYIEHVINSIKTEQFDSSLIINNLQLNRLCLARCSLDNNLYRARILRIEAKFVHVCYIDYGYEELVNLSSLLIIENIHNLDLFKIPPQAEKYVLAQALSNDHSWKFCDLQILKNRIVNRKFVCKIVRRTKKISIIKLMMNNQSICCKLIDQLSNNVSFVSVAEQETLLLSCIISDSEMESQSTTSNDESLSSSDNCKYHDENLCGYPRHAVQMPLKSLQMPNKYISKDHEYRNGIKEGHHPRSFDNPTPLKIHSRHMVIVSAVEEGPLVFSVQLMDMKKNLEQLMIEINKSRRLPFEQIPNNGCVCLGRKADDGLLYRSIIMGLENTNSLKLYHVDYGTTELVSFTDIFQIETKFLQHKVYSHRFALQGLSIKADSMQEIKDVFSKIISNKIVELEVVPPEGPPIVQYCNLYIGGLDIKNKITEIMKKPCGLSTSIGNLVYEEEKVSTGERHNIIVSYIDSVKQFYIHLLHNKDKLDAVMNRLYIYCKSAPALSHNDLRINMPCAALYTEDQVWYRALVVSIDSTLVTVQYVDYGNYENVEVSSLKYLPPELITTLKAQAILCNLIGLEGIIQNENTSTQLEMLCLEKTLVMTVMDYNQFENSALVDLEDYSVTPPLNISKRIIELSTPRLIRPSVSNPEETSANRIDMIANITDDSAKQTQIKSRPDQTVSTFKNQISTHINRNFANMEGIQSSQDLCKKQANCDPSLKSAKQSFSNKLHNFASTPMKESQNSIAISTSKEAMMYKIMDVTENQKVIVSWFINPLHFYCQVLEKQPTLVLMMKSIQKYYAKENNIVTEPVLGSPVIVKYPQDSIFYRGTVFEKKLNKYVIDFVDYGFKNVVDLCYLYPMAQQFLEQPKMAIRCKIHNVLPNKNKSSDISQAWELFKKEEYVCIFYDRGQNNSMIVDLMFNGQSISSELVQKGFAIKAEEDIKEVIEFSLLRGQTIRCKVLGIVHFGKFFVKFQGMDSQIECSLYNWTVNQASAEFSRMKKKFSDIVQEKDVIIFINDIEKSKLFVTLYDSTGIQIKDFSGNDSYPVISPICPKTVLSSDMSVYFTHVESNHVYVQDEKERDQSYTLLEGLYDFYEKEGKNLQIEPCEGSICAARSPSDNNWYRALITQTSYEGVMVKYIDYGNSELLKSQDIRELHPNYYEINELCLETFVDSDFEYDPECTEAYNINLTLVEETWKLTLKNHIIDGKIAESNIIPHLEESKQDTGYLTDTLNTDNLGTVSDHVVISHIDSPGQFWIQYQNYLDDLHLMHTSLQNVAEKLPSLTNLQVGEKCIARYSIDNQWYRAEVLDADNDITTVRFIDYGNTDVINNFDNILKEIDGDLKRIAPYAKKCSLMALPLRGDEWNEEACQEFDKFADISDSFIVDVVAENEKCCYVNLEIGDRNICNELVLKKYAVIMDKVNEVNTTNPSCIDSDVITQKKRGYISHVVDLSEFYVQLECDRAGLEYLEDAFTDASSFPIISEVVEDMVCVAQYHEDGLWYRASISKILDFGYEVFFIDFGNTAVTSEIRVLPHAVNNIGQLAKHCSLFVPTGFSDKRLDAAKKLKELAADGLTIFEIEFISLNAPYTVQLYINGEDVQPSICTKD